MIHNLIVDKYAYDNGNLYNKKNGRKAGFLSNGKVYIKYTVNNKITLETAVWIYFHGDFDLKKNVVVKVNEESSSTCIENLMMRPKKGLNQAKNNQPNVIPSKTILQSLFDYKNGLLIWKSSGLIAGTQDGDYLRVKIDGKKYYSHRLIYQYHYGDLEPADMIDHINGDKSDNSIKNLRKCSNAENQLNRKPNKGLAYKGVYQISEGRYKSTLKDKHLGVFPSELEAAMAYNQAALKEYGPEFIKLNKLPVHC